MHRCRQFSDVLLEEPEGVGVCQHDPRHVTVEVLAQDRRADQAPLVGRDADGGVAGEAYRRRVGPVRRVRDQHLGRRPARLLVPGAHYQQPGQLTGGAGGRLQGRRVHARDTAQGVGQVPQELQPSLGVWRRRGRVHAAKPGQGGRLVAHLGVVLHRARPEGVSPEVDRVLPVGQARHMRRRDRARESRPGPAARGGALRPGAAPRPAIRGPRSSGTTRNGGPGRRNQRSSVPRRGRAAVLSSPCPLALPYG